MSKMTNTFCVPLMRPEDQRTTEDQEDTDSAWHKYWYVSHPVPDPVIGPRRRTPTGPTGPPGLLFELSAPLTRYLLITYTSASAPTPDSACLRTPAPLRSIIPFILPPYLPHSCLPVCIRFLVPDFDSCPYSSDSDRTSYTDSLS